MTDWRHITGSRVCSNGHTTWFRFYAASERPMTDEEIADYPTIACIHCAETIPGSAPPPPPFLIGEIEPRA